MKGGIVPWKISAFVIQPLKKPCIKKKKKTGLVADTWVWKLNEVEVFLGDLILGNQQFKSEEKPRAQFELEPQ